MKKILSVIVALFSIVTLVLATGCGGPKLEGQWIGTGEVWLFQEPAAVIMTIKKAKDSDTNYNIYMHMGLYEQTKLLGKNYRWSEDNHDDIFPAVYDKEKGELRSIPDKNRLGGDWELHLKYKDGKWVMAEIHQGLSEITFEPYSDSTFAKAQKACQDELKKKYGDKVTFEETKKK